MFLIFCLIVAQIVLESLPVSSSGHLRLIELIYSCFSPSSFDYVLPRNVEYSLHVVTCLVLVFMFWRMFIPTLKHPLFFRRVIIKIFLLGFVADIITVFWYLLFEAIGVGWFPVWIGFYVTAASLFSLRFCREKNYSKWNFASTILLGFVQGISLLPGVSRLATTFVAARWMRISPRRAIQISLLIQFPLIVAGCVKGIASLVVSGQWHFWLHVETILVMIIAGIGAFLSLHLIIRMAVHKRFWWFAPYLFFVGSVFATLQLVRAVVGW